jgi:hypothetical protein
MGRINKEIKSNIKCEHCQSWNHKSGYCVKNDVIKHYWNRCKMFKWGKVK